MSFPKHADQFVLVIRGNTPQGERNLFNYKIQKTEYGSFFITEKTTFETVSQLIEYYQNNDGLKVRLNNPIVRVKEEGRERDQWEIRRNDVQKTKMLGSGHFGEVLMVVLVIVVVTIVCIIVCNSGFWAAAPEVLMTYESTFFQFEPKISGPEGDDVL